MNRKGVSGIAIVVIVVVILLAGLVLYKNRRKFFPATPTVSPTQAQPPTNTPTSVPESTVPTTVPTQPSRTNQNNQPPASNYRYKY